MSVFRSLGVDHILGLDGEHVDVTQLQIPPGSFRAYDLSAPFSNESRFDLALCLELAEHLPESAAMPLVESLTKLSPCVLFSAAIPFQGGTHHVNEQWPRYWAEKFSAYGYEAVDCLRKTVWDDERVEWWYAQNVILYVGEEHPLFGRFRRDAFNRAPPLSLVHPRKYLDVIRAQLFIKDFAGLLGPDATCILVDQDQLRHGLTFCGKTVPFLEHNGAYWGPPATDNVAIEELERLRRAGASAIVFTWPAFWWLDHYRRFLEYLRLNYPCTLNNERLVAFDLTRRF